MKRKTPEQAVILGLHLKEQKDALPHGSFTSWVKRTYGFHPTTARSYMRLAADVIQAAQEAKRSR